LSSRRCPGLCRLPTWRGGCSAEWPPDLSNAASVTHVAATVRWPWREDSDPAAEGLLGRADGNWPRPRDIMPQGFGFVGAIRDQTRCARRDGAQAWIDVLAIVVWSEWSFSARWRRHRLARRQTGLYRICDASRMRPGPVTQIAEIAEIAGPVPD